MLHLKYSIINIQYYNKDHIHNHIQIGVQRIIDALFI